MPASDMASPRQNQSTSPRPVGDGTSSSQRSRVVIVAVQAMVIVLVVFCCYWPAVSGGFLWDDNDFFINENPEHPTLRLIHADDGLYGIWFSAEAVDYWPLTLSAFWVQWRCWGMEPQGYHLTNIALHAIGAILVWRVLAALRIPGAWLGALLFCAHPVNVASVAWISELKNVLSLPLYAGSLLYWIHFDDTQKKRWYGLALLAFVLALTAKASTVTLPLVLLGLAWWRHGRIGRRDCLRVAPFLLLSLVMGLVTLSIQHAATAQLQLRPEGLASRIAAIGWVFWHYLFTAIAPFRLSMVYPRWEVDPASFTAWIPLMALVLVFALLWRYRRTVFGRPLLAALGYFVLSLAPVSGILSMSFHRYSLVSDHLQHLALPAITTLIAAALVHWTRKSGQLAAPLGIAFLLVVGSCLLTFQRAEVFQSGNNLWQNTLRKNPMALVAHVNLGAILHEEGHFDDAVKHHEKALRINAKSFEARSNLATSLQSLGRYEESILNYQYLLQRHPRSSTTYSNLAWLYATCPDETLRDGPQALAHAQRALQLGGRNNPWILGSLAGAFAETGDFEMAMFWQSEALEIVPQSHRSKFQQRLDMYVAGKPFRDLPAKTSNDH